MVVETSPNNREASAITPEPTKNPSTNAIASNPNYVIYQMELLYKTPDLPVNRKRNKGRKAGYKIIPPTKRKASPNTQPLQR